METANKSHLSKNFSMGHNTTVCVDILILLNIPIPPSMYIKMKRGKWNLIDGQQRLSTIFKFMGILKNESEDGSTEEVEVEPLTCTKFLPSLRRKILG